MRIEITYIFLLLKSDVVMSAFHNRTFVSQLQELCPYTSFCEENATMYFPESDTKRPCCEPCSCKPGCENDDNCCFVRNDYGRTCLPPTTNKKATVINYKMIRSCNLNDLDNSNGTMCAYDDSDYKSLAPVVSKKSGEIFVNSECAYCNQVHDIIPWTLSINCPPGIEKLRNEISLLLSGEDVIPSACYLSYVPPKHMNLESHECRNDIIRECNVSGKTIEWEPLWDYCPMFNAPFFTLNQVYGNVFCLLCNQGYKYPVISTCRGYGYKHPTTIGFVALIENTDFMEEKSKPVNNVASCGPTEKLVHSFKTECRKVECSLGKIRIGGKCRFYSKEWIGGVFAAFFKLTPLDKTMKVNISILSHLQAGFKNDKKATWLKRNTMKSWNVGASYRPSVDNKFIMYFVVQLWFPHESANPARLWTSLSKALKDIWTLNTKLDTIRFRVQFNRHENYKKMNKIKAFHDYGIHIDQEYGFFIPRFQNNDEAYLLPVFPIDNYYIDNNLEYLNELFLCDQIELRTEEVLWNMEPSIILTTTNETLYDAEFRPVTYKNPFVCLSRFTQNKSLRCVHHFQMVCIVVLLVVAINRNCVSHY